AALFTTVVLGGALVQVLRSERRRADLEPLLSTIVMSTSSADVPALSLRRSGPQRNALPTVLSRRLDLAFAATGDRIRLAHLAATGIGAAAATGLAAVTASVHSVLAIALGGAAAIVAPVL